MGDIKKKTGQKRAEKRKHTYKTKKRASEHPSPHSADPANRAHK